MGGDQASAQTGSVLSFSLLRLPVVSEDGRSLAVTSHGLFTCAPKKVLVKELCESLPSPGARITYLPASTAERTISTPSVWTDAPDHFDVPFVLNHRSLARSRFAFSFGVASLGSYSTFLFMPLPVCTL